MKNKKKIDGFSLVEVISALVIFAIIIPSFYMAIQTSLKVVNKDKELRIIFALDNQISLLKLKYSNNNINDLSELSVDNKIYETSLNFFSTEVTNISRVEVNVKQKLSKELSIPLQRYFFEN